MKTTIAIFVLILSLMAAPAQASDVSAYILQKQMHAQKLKARSENKLSYLRSQPARKSSFMSIAPKFVEHDVAMTPPTPEELEMIEAAAGGNEPQNEPK